MSLGSKQSREEHRTHSRGARPHGGPALGRPPGLLGAKPGWLGPRGDTRSSAGAQRSRSVLGAGAPGCLCASGCAADAVPVTQSHSDPGREEGRAQPLRTRAAAGARGGRLPSQAAPAPRPSGPPAPPGLWPGAHAALCSAPTAGPAHALSSKHSLHQYGITDSGVTRRVTVPAAGTGRAVVAPAPCDVPGTPSPSSTVTLALHATHSPQQPRISCFSGARVSSKIGWY